MATTSAVAPPPYTPHTPCPRVVPAWHVTRALCRAVRIPPARSVLRAQCQLIPPESMNSAFFQHENPFGDILLIPLFFVSLGL